MNVGQLMTRNIVTVSPETKMRDVARLLVEKRISGVPVVDGENRLLGVVSESDLLFHEVSSTNTRIWDYYSGPMYADPMAWAAMCAAVPDALMTPDYGKIIHKMLESTAGEIMTTPAVSVDSGEDVIKAAKLMMAKGIKRLPVIEGGKLAGIISRSDFVRFTLGQV